MKVFYLKNTNSIIIKYKNDLSLILSTAKSIAFEVERFSKRQVLGDVVIVFEVKYLFHCHRRFPEGRWTGRASSTARRCWRNGPGARARAA